MDVSTNPLAVLTFISAPAVLTNASCVLLFGTGNRYGRAIDRVHDLAEMIRDHEGAQDDEQRLRMEQLSAGERRAGLIVRALTCFYAAVASFIASTLVCLLGAVLNTVGGAGGFNVSLVCALLVGIVGMLSIMTGALMLVRESWFSFRILQKERVFLDKYLRRA
jgi:hypothetical protein